MNNNSRFPKALFFVYVIFFIWLGIAPYSREVWYAELVPIFAIAVYITVLYIRGIRFSNLSYIFMSVLLFMHTIGGHFTFERVPFDWFSNFFGFERNMYDRVAHFAVGFYAYPIAEYIRERKLANSKWITYLLPLCFVMSVALTYELIEWQYAVHYGGASGAAFLGSQGDTWDAQADMALDTLGGIFSLAIFFLAGCFHKRNVVQ